MYNVYFSYPIKTTMEMNRISNYTCSLRTFEGVRRIFRVKNLFTRLIFLRIVQQFNPLSDLRLMLFSCVKRAVDVAIDPLGRT